MYTQYLTPAPIVEELDDWEACIRASWPTKLPALDVANVWHMPDSGAINLYSLVFRQLGDNSHRNTDWFLIDPHLDKVQRFVQQHVLYMYIKPNRGTVDMLWKRQGTWYTMAAATPYSFNIQKHRTTGRFVNAKEQQS